MDNCIICGMTVGPTEGATVSTYIHRLGREVIRVMCPRCSKHDGLITVADRIIQRQMEKLYDPR